MMFRYFSILFLLPTMLWFSSDFAYSQNRETVRAKLARNQIVESFAGRAGANVSSGSELVGVMLGTAPVVSEKADVLLVSHKSLPYERICVRVVTRDGLFWSDNPFNVPKNNTGRVLAGPVAKRHLSDLQEYLNQDVMVRIVSPLSGDCSVYDESNVVMPAIGKEDGYLRAYLLTRGRAASARLKRLDSPGKYFSTVRCESFPTGSTVAADRVCKLLVPPQILAGRYDLHVRIKGRFEKKDLHYVIQLPGRE